MAIPADRVKVTVGHITGVDFTTQGNVTTKTTSYLSTCYGFTRDPSEPIEQMLACGFCNESYAVRIHTKKVAEQKRLVRVAVAMLSVAALVAMGIVALNTSGTLPYILFMLICLLFAVPCVLFQVVSQYHGIQHTSVKGHLLRAEQDYGFEE